MTTDNSAKNHCWACKYDFDGSEEICDHCQTGRICPACGKCHCDYKGKGGENTPKVDLKILFQKLVDEAEEVQITEKYDLEPIEMELLAGAMQESGMPNALAPDLFITRLEPSVLQSGQLRTIAEVLFPIIKANSRLNDKVLSKLFRNDALRQVTGELMGMTYDVSLFGTYIEQIQRAAQARDISRVIAPLCQQLMTEIHDQEALTETVLRARTGLVEPIHREMVVISERCELLGYYKRLEDYQQERDFEGFDSGFKHFNRVINGLCVGFLVFAGTPGAGKTTLIKQLHYQVALLNGIPVIFISYEQSKDELRVKDLSRLSKVVNRDIIRGKHDKSMESWKKVQKAAVDIYRTSALQYIVEADHRWDVNRIRAYVEGVMVQCKTDKCVVFIDYLQKVPPTISTSVASRRDDVSVVCSDLTRMARSLRVPVIALSSESRASYNKTGLDVFKESGEIEYSADVAGVLHIDKERSGEYSEKFTKQNENRRAVDLCIVKNRNGELAKISFDFYPQFGLFNERNVESMEFHQSLPDVPGKGSRSGDSK